MKPLRCAPLWGILFGVILASAGPIFGREPFPERIELEPAGTIPHQKNAYCQGLFFERTADGTGILYESCGRYGKSRIHILDAETGKSLKEAKLPKKIFAEGLTVFGGEIYLLSWREGIGSVRDKETLKEVRSFRYQTEGWGLTSDGTDLLLSDGSDAIRRFSAGGFLEKGKLTVTYTGTDGKRHSLKSLNELEWINGEIWANIYQTPYIARINPQTGEVRQILNLSFYIPKGYEEDRDRVLNGIAWDEETKTLYLTGKDWPVIYRFRIPAGVLPADSGRDSTVEKSAESNGEAE